MQTSSPDRFQTSFSGAPLLRAILAAWTRPVRLPVWLPLAMLAGILAGCATPAAPTSRDPVPYSEVRLREGDIIKISFPGAPNLDATQQIRRDGKITLSLGGEVVALGRTPSELEKELLKLYDAQLAVKQVVVSVTLSTFPVFVTGAVLRPGKFLADRPITALEAIMEAGGFDYAKAKLDKVTVLRQAEGQVVSYRLDFKQILKSPKSDPFYLKPSDTVYVPEKFNWF
jgi:polysaccharide export outer membrane protein